MRALKAVITSVIYLHIDTTKYYVDHKKNSNYKSYRLFQQMYQNSNVGKLKFELHQQAKQDFKKMLGGRAPIWYTLHQSSATNEPVLHSIMTLNKDAAISCCCVQVHRL